MAEAEAAGLLEVETAPAVAPEASEPELSVLTAG